MLSILTHSSGCFFDQTNPKAGEGLSKPRYLFAPSREMFFVFFALFAVKKQGRFETRPYI
jgi:hypothetical protein